MELRYTASYTSAFHAIHQEAMKKAEAIDAAVQFYSPWFPNPFGMSEVVVSADGKVCGTTQPVEITVD